MNANVRNLSVESFEKGESVLNSQWNNNYKIVKVDSKRKWFIGPKYCEISYVGFPESTNENTTYLDKILMHVGMGVSACITEAQFSNRCMVLDELKQRTDMMREDIKNKYGLRVPSVKILDDESISSSEFFVRVNNTTTKSMEIRPNCVFATFPDNSTKFDFGEEFADKALGLKGYWISKSMVSNVISRCTKLYSVLDIIMLYLKYMIENNLDKIVTREDIKQYKNEVKLYNAAIIDEIDENKIPSAIIHKVVKRLLKEKISIKNFEYILESIADYYNDNSHSGGLKFEDLMIFIRKRISNVITENFIKNGVLNVINLSNDSTRILSMYSRGVSSDNIENQYADIMAGIVASHMKYSDLGQKFVFVSNDSVRLDIFNILSELNVKINIISYDEFPRIIKMEIIKTI